MRVIISGGKNIGRAPSRGASADLSAGITRASNERAFVLQKLSELHAEMGFTLVMGGEQGGAERLGMTWARMNDIPTLMFQRERKLFREETSQERLARMLSTGKADLVVAIGGAKLAEELVRSAGEKALRVLPIDLPA